MRTSSPAKYPVPKWRLEDFKSNCTLVEGQLSEIARRNHPSPDEPPLTHAELNRVVPIKEAARLLGVHEDTLRNNFRDLLVRVGVRRLGLRYKDILAAAQSAA